MPVTKSASKKMRQDIKKRRLNQLKKENLKNLLKKARREPTEKNIKVALSFLDKAAKINLIHENKASRLKSRLSKLKTKSRGQKEVKKERRPRAKKRAKFPPVIRPLS